MRTLGGIAAFVGTVFVVSNAAAEESAVPLDGAEARPVVERPTLVDRLFGNRTLGDIARDLVSRFVDEQRDEFDRMAERYTRLVEFTKRLEQRDEAEFEARAERYEKLRRFTRRLEAEQAEREARDFQAQVDLFVRERAFTRELERRRAEGLVDTPAAPQHWQLYLRE